VFRERIEQLTEERNRRLNDLLTNATDAFTRARLIRNRWENTVNEFVLRYDLSSSAVSYATHTGSADDAARARELTARTDELEADCIAIIDELIRTNADRTLLATALILRDEAYYTRASIGAWDHDNWSLGADNFKNTAIVLYNAVNRLRRYAGREGVRTFLRDSPAIESARAAYLAAEWRWRDAARELIDAEQHEQESAADAAARADLATAREVESAARAERDATAAAFAAAAAAREVESAARARRDAAAAASDAATVAREVAAEISAERSAMAAAFRAHPTATSSIAEAAALRAAVRRRRAAPPIFRDVPRGTQNIITSNNIEEGNNMVTWGRNLLLADPRYYKKSTFESLHDRLDPFTRQAIQNETEYRAHLVGGRHKKTRKGKARGKTSRRMRRLCK